MRPHATRSLLWLLAAISAIALIVGLRAAAAASDPTMPLVVTILVELALGLAGHLVFAARSDKPVAHTRARWRVLDAIRALATALTFGYLIGLLVASLFGVALDDPWLQLGLLAPLGGAALCLVAAVLEHERFEVRRRAARPEPSRPRKVYETRTGAVVVESHDGHEEVVLTGRDGRRDVDAVAREIDRRGWREGEAPPQAALHEALQRWGVLRETE